MLATDWLKHCLEEDIGSGDVTTQALIMADRDVVGEIIAKDDGVACGLKLMAEIAKALGGHLELQMVLDDGLAMARGDVVARFQGSHALMLQAERTYLNLVQRLCGIASMTRRYVDAVAHTRASILDTRKTIPGLRLLEKEAVKAGGGVNHRMGLHDAFLIKENHLQAFRHLPNPFLTALEAARCHRDDLPLIIEVEDLSEFRLALDGLPDVILLDNMSLDDMREAVEIVDRENMEVKCEASGGITMDRLKSVAETGVHRISVGAITHSALPLDLSLLVKVD